MAVWGAVNPCGIPQDCVNAHGFLQTVPVPLVLEYSLHGTISNYGNYGASLTRQLPKTGLASQKLDIPTLFPLHLGKSLNPIDVAGGTPAPLLGMRMQAPYILTRCP